MTETQKILLSLVRNSLWNTPVQEIPSDFNWNELLKIASQQTLLGHVADAMKNVPEESCPDDSLMQRLQMHLIRNFQAHALLNTRLSEVLAVLDSAGIQGVLFKGQGIATNYPEPLLRQCGDIDMYVGTDNYDRACRILLDKFGTGNYNSETVKHFHLHTSDVIVEVHKIAETVLGSRRNKRFQKWTKESLRPENLRILDINGTEVPVPPLYFDLIYIMHHAWHHFLNGGIGLRQLCDWTMLLHRHHEEIDAGQLKRNLKDFGLLKVWEMFAGIAVRHLGLPASECPLYSGKYSAKSDRIMEFIFAEGNFGHHAKRDGKPRPKGYTAGKLHSLRNSLKRYMGIFPIYPVRVSEALMAFIIKGTSAFIEGLK